MANLSSDALKRARASALGLLKGRERPNKVALSSCATSAGHCSARACVRSVIRSTMLRRALLECNAKHAVLHSEIAAVLSSIMGGPIGRCTAWLAADCAPLEPNEAALQRRGVAA